MRKFQYLMFATLNKVISWINISPDLLDRRKCGKIENAKSDERREEK